MSVFCASLCVWRDTRREKSEVQQTWNTGTQQIKTQVHTVDVDSNTQRPLLGGWSSFSSCYSRSDVNASKLLRPMPHPFLCVQNAKFCQDAKSSTSRAPRKPKHKSTYPGDKRWRAVLPLWLPEVSSIFTHVSNLHAIQPFTSAINDFSL